MHKNTTKINVIIPCRPKSQPSKMFPVLEKQVNSLDVDVNFQSKYYGKWYRMVWCINTIVVLTQTTSLLNHLKPLLCYFMLC